MEVHQEFPFDILNARMKRDHVRVPLLQARIFIHDNVSIHMGYSTSYSQVPDGHILAPKLTWNCSGGAWTKTWERAKLKYA